MVSNKTDFEADILPQVIYHKSRFQGDLYFFNIGPTKMVEMTNCINNFC